MRSVFNKLFVLGLMVLVSPFPEVLGQVVVNKQRRENDRAIFERLERLNGGELRYVRERLYIKPVMGATVEGIQREITPGQVHEWVMNLDDQADYEYSKKTQDVIANIAKEKKISSGVKAVNLGTPEWSQMHGVFLNNFMNFVNGGGITGFMFGDPDLDYIRAQARDCTANHNRFANSLYSSLEKRYSAFKRDWELVKNDDTLEGIKKKKKLIDDTVQLFVELEESLAISRYIKTNYGAIPINCPVFQSSWNWNKVQAYLDGIKSYVEPKAKQLLGDVEKFESKMAVSREILDQGYQDYCLQTELLNVQLFDFQHSVSMDTSCLRAEFLREDLGGLLKQLELMRSAAKTYGLADLEQGFKEKAEEIGVYKGFVDKWLEDAGRLNQTTKVDETMRYLLGSQGETRAYELEGTVDTQKLKEALGAYEKVVSGEGGIEFERFQDLMDAHLGESSGDVELSRENWSVGEDYRAGTERQLYYYELSDPDVNAHLRIGLMEEGVGDAEGLVLSGLEHDAGTGLFSALYRGKAGDSMVMEFNAGAARRVMKVREAAQEEVRFVSSGRKAAMEKSWEVFEEQEVVKSGIFSGGTLRMLGSFLVDCVPIVGAVKGFVEFGVGVDPITGESLGRLETGLALAASVLPIPGAKHVGKAVGKVLSKSGKVGKGLVHKGFNRGLSNRMKGELGEAAAKETMERAGYRSLPCKLKSNNGFDGVYVKYKDGTDNVVDTIIVESKASSSGRFRLSDTQTMGKQMSDEWIEANIDKMVNLDVPEIQKTGLLLLANKNNIRKKINVLTPDGKNSWKNVKLTKK